MFLGDAEFLAIVDEGALPTAGERLKLQRQIQDALLARRVKCPITLAIENRTFLSRLRPHIFAYELRTCGEVVWGPPEILSLIPDFSPSAIPLEDAWRTLCNRLIEQLEMVVEFAGRPEPLPPGIHYRTVKLYLDMATSLLLFAGAYAPTYRVRAQNLRALAQRPASRNEWPFSLEPFAREVTRCTKWKLGAGESGARVNWDFWQTAVDYARLLWHWELARMSDAPMQLPARVLLQRWMRLQPFLDRSRGWAHALRKQGWYRNWRDWPRWGWMGWQASPRYWIYGAAAELSFRLPQLVGREQLVPDVSWEELHEWLPVRDFPQRTAPTGWRDLAAHIVWNYKEFLVDTRS